jgi:hypothetical protein
VDARHRLRAELSRPAFRVQHRALEHRALARTAAAWR